MSRAIEKSKELIDFRHVIDSMVRKPGAFAYYFYREHLYPSIKFRKLFDSLIDRLDKSAGTAVLRCAKHEGLAGAESIAQRMIAIGIQSDQKVGVGHVEGYSIDR